MITKGSPFRDLCPNLARHGIHQVSNPLHRFRHNQRITHKEVPSSKKVKEVAVARDGLCRGAGIGDNVVGETYVPWWRWRAAVSAKRRERGRAVNAL